MTSTLRIGRASRGGSRTAAFTLIELMVALALGSIIAVVISIVSTQAREAYTQTINKVDVYKSFRLAFKMLEDDLAGWIPTSELEFYTDGRGGRPRDRHWQPGEQTPDRTDQWGRGQVDGGTYGDYDEYAFIEQLQYTSLEPSEVLDGEIDKKLHDAYRIYFKTMTYVEGAVREATVEYLLVDPTVPQDQWVNGVPPPPSDVKPADVKNLTLYKIVRYYPIDESTIMLLNRMEPKRQIIEVATNVTDFRLEYFVTNPFERQPGRQGGRFVTPEEDFSEPVELATRPSRSPHPRGGPGEVYRKVFGYGSMKVEQPFPRATAYVARVGDNQLRGTVEHRPLRFGFESSPQIRFSELGPGDSIYVFTESAISTGGAAASGGLPNIMNSVRIPVKDYTIKSNLQGLLEFVEDIDASGWGEQNQSPILYKAAFIPSAVRLTLRMVDDEGLNPKTMQQVVWMLRRSR